MIEDKIGLIVLGLCVSVIGIVMLFTFLRMSAKLDMLIALIEKQNSTLDKMSK